MFLIIIMIIYYLYLFFIFFFRLQDVLNNLKQKLAKQEKQYRFLYVFSLQFFDNLI